MTSTLHCGKFRLPMDRPLIMGIVNLTPDSFSGDGLAGAPEQALAQAHAQIAAGADIIDLGAESSRPGVAPTSEQEELARLLPVLENLAEVGVPVSVDTYKPAVMRAALASGAAMINDIYGLRQAGVLPLLAASDCAVCIMHMQGVPATMQQAPHYQDVVAEVTAFLAQRVAAAEAAGIDRRRLLVDPGFGFGKSLADNLALLRALETLRLDGLPLLAGLSRKSMLGTLTGRSVEARLPASLAAAVLAAEQGARVLRVHDVAATRDALAVWAALRCP